MFKRILVTICILFLSFNSFAQENSQKVNYSSLSAEDKMAVIEDLVAFLMSNPLIVKELLNRSNSFEGNNVSSINTENNIIRPFYGNKDGKIIIKDFIDLSCSLCMDITLGLKTIADENSNIRIDFIDTPINNNNSYANSLFVLASFEKGSSWFDAVKKINTDPDKTNEFMTLISSSFDPALIDKSINTIKYNITLLKFYNKYFTTLPAIIIVNGNNAIPLTGNFSISDVKMVVDKLK